MSDDFFRKAVTTMHRGISTAATSPTRAASWIRKDYPPYAPERGHSYLFALCGGRYAAR